MNTIVVSDTTAITQLAKINSLYLLQELYMTIYIPEAVYLELTGHGDNIPGSLEVKNSDWIITKKVKNIARVHFFSSFLDPGESEAIALAEEINADLLIIDEKIGRTQAMAAGLNITGMIGILLIAKERKFIPKVKPFLDKLILTNFKLGLNLYEQALMLAGEKNEEKKA